MQPESGFQTHAHQNMEMIALVLEGELQHRDSLGHQKWIHSGEIQRMSAGTGVTYSEGNSSKTEVLHLFQIWIHPCEFELEPSYEQKSILSCSSSGLLRLIASSDSDSGGAKIHQDVLIYLGDFQCGEKVEFKVREGRFVWIQVIRDSISIPGMSLMSGDGGLIEGVGILEIAALDSSKGAQIMVFDLP